MRTCPAGQRAQNKTSALETKWLCQVPHLNLSAGATTYNTKCQSMITRLREMNGTFTDSVLAGSSEGAIAITEEILTIFPSTASGIAGSRLNKYQIPQVSVMYYRRSQI